MSGLRHNMCFSLEEKTLGKHDIKQKVKENYILKVDVTETQVTHKIWCQISETS